MNILNNYDLYNNYHTEFKAKMPLNDCRQFLSSQIQGTSNLDIIFKETGVIKTLNNLSVFLTKNIINKTKNQDNIITKLLNTASYKLTQMVRTLSIKIFTRQNNSAINELSNPISPESKEYIEELAKIGNSVKGKFVRINSEDKPLDCIAESKTSTIFVLNHPDYNKDKICYAIINSLISKLYVSKNRQTNCPRSQLLSSRNLMKILGEKLSKICKNFLGIVSIDADPKKGNSIINVSPMLKLLKDFIDNKVNIFIFPEGNNSLVKDTTLEERIQPGIAGIIKAALEGKDSVRIIPIGLSYTGEKNSFGNIFIGTPIFFKKIKRGILYTQGTEKKKIIRIDRKNLSQNILNEICENLKYCMQKSSEL